MLTCKIVLMGVIKLLIIIMVVVTVVVCLTVSYLSLRKTLE